MTGLVIVGAVALGGALLRRGSEKPAPTAGPVVPSSLVLLELRSDAGPLFAVVGSSGTPAPASLVLPGSVLMVIPGQGDGSIKDAGTLPATEAATAISNLIGEWIPHYAVTDAAHFGAVVDRVGGIQMFGSTKDGAAVAAVLDQIGPARLLSWQEALIGLFQAGPAWSGGDFVETDDGTAAASVLTGAKGATVELLPNTQVTPGFLRPDYAAIGDLMTSAFAAPNQPPVRVIVLNGTGTPGVGESVAERLVPGGFRIMVSENASTFNHKVTLVVAGSEDFRAAAGRARKLLGVGEVSVAGVPSGLGDVTILVGRDYLNG